MLTGVTLRSTRAELLNSVLRVFIGQKCCGSFVHCSRNSSYSYFYTGSHWKSGRNYHNRNRKTFPIFGVPLTFEALSFFTTKDTEPRNKMGDDPVAKALQEADVFYKDNKFQEVYDTLSKFKDNTGHCELQWKLARAARDLAQLSATPKDQKKELIHSGLQFAENAVAANDQEFAAHKWKGILLSDVSAFEGYKKQIANAYLIRDEFLKACELNPEDPLSHFLIGEWCFTVADMSWVQRQAAKTFFGTPPTSSYDEALKHFHKAEEVKSGFYVGNYVSIGKAYLRLKKNEEAKTWLQKAVDFTSENEKDDKCKNEAKEMLKKL